MSRSSRLSAALERIAAAAERTAEAAEGHLEMLHQSNKSYQEYARQARTESSDLIGRQEGLIKKQAETLDGLRSYLEGHAADAASDEPGAEVSG